MAATTEALVVAQPRQETETGELSISLGEMLALLAQCEEPEDSDTAAALDADVQANVAQAIVQKLRRYQGFFSFCKAQVAECDQEIERLQARKQAIKGGKERLRKYLARAMARNRIRRLDAGTVVFTLMPGAKSLFVSDPEKIPYQFKTEKIVCDLDNAAIRRALDAEEKVDGAELIVGDPFVTVR
jgi:hypothetical protein